MRSDKRLFLMLASMFLLSISFASADCNLDISLLNQDPYPAIPGEYVDLVFQVSGVSDTECSDITVELLEEYPLEFDPGVSNVRTFNRVNYISDLRSTISVPFKVRINEDALEGPNDIKVTAQSRGDASFKGEFTIDIEDSIVDFEAYVKDYDFTTKELEIEVLNIGGSDIKALTIQIPKQDIIEVKGSNRIVVGDLDSNEFTSADFEATPNNGIINIDLIYSDAINVRRTVTKGVVFDSSYFTGRVADQETGPSTSTYVIVVLVIVFIIYFFISRRKRKKIKR